MVALLLTDIAGFAVWNGVRSTCYNYLRQYNETATQDTITVSKSTYMAGNAIVHLEEDEIEYNGRMFDISQQLLQDDNILLVGRYDTFEDKLFKVLHNLVDDEDDSKENQHFEFWSWDAIIPHPLASFTVYTTNQQLYYHHNDNRLIIHDTNPLTAPPEVTVC